MFRKGCIAITIICLVFTLAACAKKEEPAVTQEPTAAPEQKAINYGEMVLVPAGDFIMGSNDKDKDKVTAAYPEHKVNLPAYWIDKYEVTNMEFLEFANEAKYAGEGAKEGKDWRAFITVNNAHNPVFYITWNDATAYCKSKGKRLPTEAEWEKAARGVDGRRYPWGNDWVTGNANTYESSGGKTSEVGKSLDVSTFGVYDAFGNVQEWTSSAAEAYKGNTLKSDLFNKAFKIIRGASTYHKGAMTHVWDRSANVPNYLGGIGCRCAKDAAPADAAQASQTK
jgi:formylglycine-generating enzyme required for sulfatase activity